MRRDGDRALKSRIPGAQRAGSFGKKHFQRRKIIAQITTVADEQAIRMQLRVRGDQEVGDDAASFASASQVGSKDFARQQRTLTRGGDEPQLPIREKLINLSGACERWTNFGQHAFADNQPAFARGFAERVF